MADKPVLSFFQNKNKKLSKNNTSIPTKQKTKYWLFKWKKNININK